MPGGTHSGLRGCVRHYSMRPVNAQRMSVLENPSGVQLLFIVALHLDPVIRIDGYRTIVEIEGDFSLPRFSGTSKERI